MQETWVRFLDWEDPLEKEMAVHSSTSATWCEELAHLKRPWCWERLKVGGEGDDRGWDGWMASPTQWTWVWVNSGSWWWTGRPGVLRFMGLQRVGYDWATELNWTDSCLENPMDKGAWWATVRGVARVRHASVTKPPALHHLVAPYKILETWYCYYREGIQSLEKLNFLKKEIFFQSYTLVGDKAGMKAQVCWSIV